VGRGECAVWLLPAQAWTHQQQAKQLDLLARP
jgi:hypothetical protein